MAKDKKVRIQVMLRPNLVKVLDEIAERSEISRSQVLEISILNLLKTAKEQSKGEEK